MLQLSIREAIEKTKDIRYATGHHLYLYRDGEVIFYVGQSADPLQRLMQHLGRDERFAMSSQLGRLIEEHEPLSLDWTLELFTLEDCASFVLEHDPLFHAWYIDTVAFLQEHGTTYDKMAVNAAEEALIEHYHPCLNRAGKTYSNPLPERYIKRKVVNQDVRITQ